MKATWTRPPTPAATIVFELTEQEANDLRRAIATVPHSVTLQELYQHIIRIQRELRS